MQLNKLYEIFIYGHFPIFVPIRPPPYQDIFHATQLTFSFLSCLFCYFSVHTLMLPL